MSPAHRGQRREPGVTVWDGSLRLFHWALVLLIAASLASGFFAPVLWLRWHLIAGAAIAALLGYRLVWGAFGPTHARFRDFARPPRVVLAHVSELLAGTAPRHLGHNPLGALMVFALLGMLAVLVATGTVVLGGMLKQGPLAHFTAFSLGAGLLGVHQVLAFLLGALIAGHLAGVAAESWRARENLVRAMLDGRKAPLAQAPAPVAARPWLAGGIIAAVLLGGGGAVAALAALPGRGVPPARLDPVYAEQCGACHMAYPPSLAPAATWAAILGDLQDHFGADASLSPELVAHIAPYLAANSAEHWDTLPAHRLRVAGPTPRLTATPFWRRTHRDIPRAVFASDTVGSRGACDACHQDAATGRFAPQRIDVPAARPSGSGR